MAGDAKAFELLDVLKRAKNWTVELSGEVRFPGSSVTELKPYHVVSNVPRLKNMKEHGLTPTDQWLSPATVRREARVACGTSRSTARLGDNKA